MGTLSGEATLPLTFLALLDEVQEKLLYYPSVDVGTLWHRRAVVLASASALAKCLSFLCDGQGAVRRAILSLWQVLLPPFLVFLVKALPFWQSLLSREANRKSLSCFFLYRLYINLEVYQYTLTLKVPITAAADDSLEYFLIVFQRK